MDLLDDDMGRWLLIFYYTLSGLLRTDIEFSMIFILIGYNAQDYVPLGFKITKVLITQRGKYLIWHK